MVSRLIETHYEKELKETHHALKEQETRIRDSEATIQQKVQGYDTSLGWV